MPRSPALRSSGRSKSVVSDSGEYYLIVTWVFNDQGYPDFEKVPLISQIFLTLLLIMIITIISVTAHQKKTYQQARIDY